MVGKYTIPGKVSQAINRIEKSDIHNSSSVEGVDQDEIVEENVRNNVAKLQFAGEDEYEESYDGTFGGRFGKSDLEEDDVILEKEEEEESIVAVSEDEHLKDDYEKAEAIEETEIQMDKKDVRVEEVAGQPNNNNAEIAVEVEVESDVESWTSDEFDQTENQTTDDQREDDQIAEVFGSEAGSKSHILIVVPDTSNENADKEEETSHSRRRHRGLCMIITIVLCIMATLLGVMLGGSDENDNTENETASSSLRGAGVIDGEEMSVPSFLPSLSPSVSGPTYQFSVVSLPSDLTSSPSLEPSESSRHLSKIPSAMPSSYPSSHPSSQPSNQPSSQPSETGVPSLSHSPTWNTTSAVPSMSIPDESLSSQSPSISNIPTSQSPTFLLRDIVHPPHNPVIPCKETVEAEMAGRINGLNGKFCGFCQWKYSGFNCYQRVNYLIAKYQDTQLESRQNLINQGRCTIPEGGVDEEMQALIESQANCDKEPVRF